MAAGEAGLLSKEDLRRSDSSHAETDRTDSPLTCADGYTATIDGMFGHDNIICCSHTNCTGNYNVCVTGGGPTTVLSIFTYTYALSWLVSISRTLTS
jgi:hypothetical protein